MKFTLLDIVQDVLSSLDSDEVNSITDTVESMQVARLARSTYLQIATRGNLASSKTLSELEAYNDPSLPVIMTKPEDIQNIDWIKYNKATVDDPVPMFQTITYLPMESFLERMYFQRTDQSNTVSGTLTIGDDSITLIWQDNVHPMYWTSMDDNLIIFDSYDSAVDTTLQKTKSMIYGEGSFDFEMVDDFMPALEESQHMLWLQETKSLAFAEIKQTVHAKAEKEAHKGWITLSKTKRGTPTHTSELDRLPNYGRRGNGGIFIGRR